MYVTADTLRTIGTRESLVVETARLLNLILRVAQITDPDQIAMFIGNFAHESARFNVAREGISRAAANAAYGYRLGNRPGTNDGYDFRGAGWVQLTGRENFRAFENWMNANPSVFGTGRVDFTSSAAAADRVGQLPWSAYASYWYKFVSQGARTMDSLRRHDFLLHCFVTNHPVSAQDILEGKPPRMVNREMVKDARGKKVPGPDYGKHVPNGWSSRVRLYEVAKAPVQRDYIAFMERGGVDVSTMKGPILASGSLPNPLDLPRSPFDPPAGTAPPIAALPPKPVQAGGTGDVLGDLFRILLPGSPVPATPGAGGSWLTGSTGSGGLRLDLQAPGAAPAPTTRPAQARQQDKGYDLMARLEQIKPEHIVALVGLGFLLSRPNLKRRREILRGK